MNAMKSLEQKIADRTAVVGVMALGYVGLPLVRAFWNAGFNCLGFDVDPAKIKALAKGENYLKHLGEHFVSDMAASDRFEATADFDRLAEADAILVCVPTPLGSHHEPDLSYVEQTARDIGKRLRPGQLVVLESTTYPGTTRDIMLPAMMQAAANQGDQSDRSNLKPGVDFAVAYSPEREDPGRKNASTQTIPKLVGGLDPASGDLAADLYRHAIKEVIRVSSAEVAEAAKILENVYRAVNIALVNELKVILTRMDIDVWEVIDAAATKPFGFQAFYPGPGLGGHCIPIDPFYLTWKARELGETTHFIELAGQVNTKMPAWVVERTMLALNNHGKAVKNSRIVVLGLAYKPNVDDVRESPSFELIKQFEALGAHVDFHDPHVPVAPPMRHYPNMAGRRTIELTDAALANADAVVIATHHAAYDWDNVVRQAKLIIDTRGATRSVTGDKNHVVSA
ncbi:MAG: nucleotide sugar dehydrogenase [Algisphaera sp.]